MSVKVENAQLRFDEHSQHAVDLRPRRDTRRANDLDGATWTKYSLSIWSDIKKSQEEVAIGHPAIFPVALVRRLIRCFMTESDQVVLDPFSGSGSTLVGAMLEHKQGIGFEIVPSYVELTKQRVGGLILPFDADPVPLPVVHQRDARELLRTIGPESVDFCLTSPPYWDILSQKRTADYKETRDYGNEKLDLAKIRGYWEFINELGKVFQEVYRSVRPGKYCVVNVMDIRKKDKFYPFHSDLARCLVNCGFIFDDVIIWDRRQEYNNLRPLGYPSVFRINKVHEYLLIFRKLQKSSRALDHPELP
jgi:DNA modification methylase